MAALKNSHFENFPVIFMRDRGAIFVLNGCSLLINRGTKVGTRWSQNLRIVEELVPVGPLFKELVQPSILT